MSSDSVQNKMHKPKINENTPVLVTEDLIKIYKSGQIETQALRGVSLAVYPGEKVFLIGPSGSGKTTLVNILAGLDKPTSGKVFWRDLSRDITRTSYEEIIKARRTFAGVIFQDSKLIAHLTVEENIRLTAHYAQMDAKELEENLEFLLKFMGIWDKRHKKENTLSGGEKKRAAIAATLITNPILIIADEPTGDLDPITGESILDLFDKINTELNIALLVVTHAQQVASRADRLLELQEGIILGQHGKSIKLRKLEESRQLEIDRQNRIILPETILSQLDNPSHFKIALENNSIVLSPVYEIEKQKDKKRVRTCPMCGKMVDEEKFCPHCGSAAYNNHK